MSLAGNASRRIDGAALADLGRPDRLGPRPGDRLMLG
jgi:hypothetical protein